MKNHKDISQGIQQIQSQTQSPRIQSIKKQFNEKQIKNFYTSQIFESQNQYRTSRIDSQTSSFINMQSYTTRASRNEKYETYQVEQSQDLNIKGVDIVKIERPLSPITFEPVKGKMKVQIKYSDPSLEQKIKQHFHSPSRMTQKRLEDRWYFEHYKLKQQNSNTEKGSKSNESQYSVSYFSIHGKQLNK